MAAKKTTSKKKHSVVPPKAKTVKPKSATEATAATPAPAAVVAKVPEAAQPVTAAATAVAEPTPAPVVTAAPAITAPAVDLSAHLAGLRSVDADVAREAAVALGRWKHADAVEPLAAAVANVDGYFHSVVRAAAAAALGEIGDPRAIPALLAGVRDEMAEASAEAVRGLAAIGDAAAAVPTLVGVVENRHGFFLPVVRRAAVLALVKLGGSEAAAAVSAVAANAYEDNSVRDAAGPANV